jgi:outer membrane lipoprotein-sorting protein
MRFSPRLAATVLLGLLSVAARGQAAPEQPDPSPPDDPWAVLTRLRQRLAAEGPLRADFTQTYVPAGFTSGESENGAVALALPDCLRWDYREPYPKSFLLCGHDAYSWNPGEPVGRHYRVESRDEPGLDLLLLSVEALRARYGATLKRGEGGVQEVWLAPLAPAANTPVSATLTLDAGGARLTGLAYRDREGNQTRFTLSNYQPIRGDGRDLFEPDRNVEWRDE